MSDYLPEDLMVNILERLSMEELMRCTLVCKKWYSFVTSPDFISMNLNRVHRTQILLGHQAVERDSDEAEFYLAKHVYESFHDLYRACEIVGNVNGLICLCLDFFPCDPVLILWNPTIKKLLRLPKPIVTFSSHGRAYSHTFGFGFDPVSSDFKLVRIVHFKDKLVPPTSNDFKDKSVPPLIELYKLSTGKWEALSRVNLPYLFDGKSFYAYLNGNLHWVGYGEKKDAIVLFNLSREEFQVMILPDDVCSSGKTKKVDVYPGSKLALITLNGDDGLLCVWIMGSYGDGGSWTKIYERSLVDVGCAGFDMGLYEALITNHQISVRVDHENNQLVMRQDVFLDEHYPRYNPCILSLHKGLPTIRAAIQFSFAASGCNRPTLRCMGAYFESLALLDKGVEVCAWNISPGEDEAKKEMEKVANSFISQRWRWYVKENENRRGVARVVDRVRRMSLRARKFLTGGGCANAPAIDSTKEEYLLDLSRYISYLIQRSCRTASVLG